MLNYLTGPKEEQKPPVSQPDNELGGSKNLEDLNETTASGSDLGESESLLGAKINKKVEEKTEEYCKPNYTMMAMFFAAGCLFLLASLTSLPLVILSPASFNMYFTLSSACFLLSVSFYYGPCVYLKKLVCNKTNLPISLLYLSSTGASLYFTFFAKIGYLYTMGMIGVQGLSVFFFVFQAWTSGDRAQDKLKEFVSSGI